MRAKIFTMIFSLAIAVNNTSAQGLFQSQVPPVGSNAPSYYYLGGREGLTIVVNLWGFVRNPGRYEVPGSTDLVQLISLGGGPLEHAQIEGVKIVRQILQPDSTYKTEVIPIDLREFEETGKKSPLLIPGDTIIIPGSTFNAIEEMLAVFRDVSLVFSGIGTFLLYLHYSRQ
jgi:hypothetical protein